MKKRIDHILQGREKHITDEETVWQPMPHKDFRFANPFIVLHHIKPKMIKAGTQSRIHPHPHRGFAPVTFMLQGEGYHKDNAGHTETVKAGDVQWMFAGKGLMHSEGPTKDFLEKGGEYALLQLWINVPAAHKWDEPTYQSAEKGQQPLIVEAEGINLRLVSGEYGGKTGPLKSFTPIVSVIGEINKGKQVQLHAQPGYWTLLYVIKGQLNINREPVAAHNLVVFEKANDEILLNATEDSQLLFLSAEPIDEPVSAKDNFVMNSPQEVEEAITDYKNGIFGQLDS